MANKIQIKRGLKASIPTADIGELLFATDTKEVFIGSSTGNVPVGGSGAVASVFGRTGAVVAVNGDYSTNFVTEVTDKRYQTDAQRTNNDATSPIQAQIDSKQSTLVSGTNVKTVGGQSIVGSGNITEVQNSITTSTVLAPSSNAVNVGLATKQSTLVSGVSIKTVNSASLLGSGNLVTPDTYATGGTYSTGTLVITNNTGGTFSVSGFSSGGGAVDSVFGRTGAVSAQAGDYTTAIVADSTDKRYQTDVQRTNNDATSPIQAQINSKQATLVSNTNIKTVGGNSLLGSGNVTEVANDLIASTTIAPSKSAVNTALGNKQDSLVSGTNIKTVGGQSIVGSGNLTEVQNSLVASTTLAPSVSSVNTGLGAKQDTLVSGTNIKTIGGVSILGSGNIANPDTFVTGGTYSTGTATFTNNTGGTFNVTGFSSGGVANGAPIGTHPVTIDGSGNLAGSLIYETTDLVNVGQFIPVINVLNKDFSDGVIAPLTYSGTGTGFGWQVVSSVSTGIVYQGGSSTLIYAVPSASTYNISFRNKLNYPSTSLNLYVDGVFVEVVRNTSGGYQTYTKTVTANTSIGITFQGLAGAGTQDVSLDDYVISTNSYYIPKNISSNSFIKVGGTSAQYLMADGSTSAGATSPVTSVFGRTGVIAAQSGDYTTAIVADSTNKRYQTDLQQSRNDATSSIQTQLNSKQATLVSGTNIKTVGGVSLLGSGDVPVAGISTTSASTASVTLANANLGQVIVVGATETITIPATGLSNDFECSFFVRATFTLTIALGSGVTVIGNNALFKGGTASITLKKIGSTNEYILLGM
jgi:hypothetical protein